MKTWRILYLIIFCFTSAQLHAGYPILKAIEGPELMHGYVQCQWDEALEARTFHFYTNLPTIYVQSGGCDVSLPPESTECDPALGMIGEYFSGTGSCQFWPGGGSAAFMCKAGKSELITIIYDVCGMMIGF